MPNVNMPGQFTVGRTNTNGTTDTNCYRGKVAILVDSRTYSQAEYTAMAFQSNPNAIVIGDTTAGSDGDVASIILPGQLQTYMPSIGIYYPDGTLTHKTGVRIDRYVRPTIDGIVAGKDEVLEEAIKIIEKQK
jgi:C-terminal processing protease CtpA/Prc